MVAMAMRKSRGYFVAVSIAGLLLAGGHYTESQADVTASGLNTSVSAIGNDFNITGGTPSGDGMNLFHSFGNFSLDSSQSALFLNNGLNPTNILGRVTGGNPSNIYGTIDTRAFPGANLFLMNPAGILLGPSAQLHVDGSFHATTADYIGFADGNFDNSTSINDAPLLTAAPEAFGFLTANPAAIDIENGDLLDGFDTSDVIIGADEETLSFVGGTVTVGTADGSAPGYVLAPAGQVNLISVASPGEATFNGTEINVDGFEQLGSVNIQGGSIIDGKNVFIRSGQLTIDEGIIFPNVFYFFGLVPPVDGGEVNIEVADNITITGTAPDPLTESPPGIFVFNGDFFDVPTVSGKVPDIKITANSVSISGYAGIQADRVGPGEPGNVIVNADTLDISSGGSIGLFNAWEGPGGNLIINAGNLTMSGDGTPSAIGFEGLGGQSLFHPLYGVSVDPALTYADGGNIQLNLSGNLVMLGQAQITTDSLNFGNSGDITVNATDIVLQGVGAETGGIGAQSALAGDAGDVTINATGSINIQDGFRISSTTIGSGNGGNVIVTAGNSITFTGADSRVLALAFPPPLETLNELFLSFVGLNFEELRVELNTCCGLPLDADQFAVLDTLNQLGFTAVTDLTPGDAGTITIRTPVLTLNTDTRLTTSTGWDGNAGAIVVDVGSLNLNNGGLIESASGSESLTGDILVGEGDAAEGELRPRGPRRREHERQEQEQGGARMHGPSSRRRARARWRAMMRGRSCAVAV